MKAIFPKEFSDLLNSKGQRLLSHPMACPEGTRLSFSSNILRKEYALQIIKDLNTYFSGELKDNNTPIPEDSISRLKRNYTEQLGKTMKMKTIDLNNSRTKSYKLAQDSGLSQMLQSASYKRMGEMMLGAEFGPPVGNQLICYGNRGYVSPHNDHHPEDKHLRKGYYDIQLMLSNSYVRHQSLVYEENGFLNKAVDISMLSGIAVYKLPFWHYTTPLEAKRHYEDKAQRWLLLGSFEMVSG